MEHRDGCVELSRQNQHVRYSPDRPQSCICPRGSRRVNRIVKFVRNPTNFGLESYENVGKSRRSCRICCRFEKYLIDFELIGHQWVLLYTLVYPSHSML